MDVPSISFFTLYRFATTKDKVFIFLAIICSILAGFTTPFSLLLFASLLQSMVDYGISVIMESPDAETFLSAIRDFAIYYSALGAAIVLLSYAATTLMNIAAYNQIYNLRQEYLKAALNQDFVFFDMNQTGNFASRMADDVVKVEDGIGEKLGTFIYFQSAFLSAITMALIKGWKLALLCFTAFPVTLTLVGIAGLIAAKLSKKEAESSGKAGSIAEEVFSAVRTVYAFSGQQKEIERYEMYLQDVRNINIKKEMTVTYYNMYAFPTALFSGIAMGTLYFCIFGAYALSLWFGYRLLSDPDENYTVETMTAVFFGVMIGSSNFGVSATLMEVFGIAKGAGAQIFYVIDNVPTINPLLNRGITPSSADGNIELKNVVFHYPSRPDVPVLKGVNLSVRRGQSVALVGHSGCGKSTIIQLISRYYDVIDGSVRVDGHDVREVSVRWLRAQVGLVGQEPVLFNTSVRENIRYGREDASDADIEAAARQANAHQFILKLPKGYDTLVGDRGASMSGGQKQRIAIARALVRNPSILLLDEATSALDTSSEAKVQKELEKAQDGVPLPNILLQEARQTIGFVPQEPILFDRTIAENIAYGDNSRKPSQDEIEAVAKQANIHNFITSLPLGYNTNIGSKGTQLSGGQKQRMAIARALIRRPQMLLLDEATSALDTESEKMVQDALNAAKAGRTCVMIAHRLSTVRDADVICVVHDGRVAEQGTHQELMDLKKLYYNLNRRGYS